MSQYITAAYFSGARLGIKTDDLGGGELDNYLVRASSEVEQYCRRVFEAALGVVEKLRTNRPREAVIGPNGQVALYPKQRFPLSAVGSLTWRYRPVTGLQMGAVSPSVQTIASGDYEIDADDFGDGYRLTIYRSFHAYRSTRAVVEFSLTYDAGYTSNAYPDWLKTGTLHWAAHLLKKRGSQAVVLEGSGIAVDQSGLGNHLAAARDALEPHVRRF